MKLENHFPNSYQNQLSLDNQYHPDVNHPNPNKGLIQFRKVRRDVRKITTKVERGEGAVGGVQDINILTALGKNWEKILKSRKQGNKFYNPLAIQI